MKVKLFVLFFLIAFYSTSAQAVSTNLSNNLDVKFGGDIQFHAKHFLNGESLQKNSDFFHRRSIININGSYTEYFSFKFLAPLK